MPAKIIKSGREAVKPKKKGSLYAVKQEEKTAKENGTARVLYLLGNKKAPEKNMQGKHDFIELIRKGVSRKSMDHLMQATGITIFEMADMMHVSERTLRRYTPATLLNPEQSERVIELARLYSRGEEVFGSIEDFKLWMDSSVMALGNKKPKAFLDTSMGIELLMDELGRIEQGVFA